MRPVKRTSSTSKNPLVLVMTRPFVAVVVASVCVGAAMLPVIVISPDRVAAASLVNPSVAVEVPDKRVAPVTDT
jgi:hypothetical protein